MAASFNVFTHMVLALNVVKAAVWCKTIQFAQGYINMIFNEFKATKYHAAQ
jgi:hypothetical protein